MDAADPKTFFSEKRFSLKLQKLMVFDMCERFFVPSEQQKCSSSMIRDRSGVGHIAPTSFRPHDFGTEQNIFVRAKGKNVFKTFSVRAKTFSKRFYATKNVFRPKTFPMAGHTRSLLDVCPYS